MSLKVEWERPPVFCKLCGEGISSAGKQETHLKCCVLCGYTTGESLCQDCCIPWPSSWIQSLHDLPDHIMLHDPSCGQMMPDLCLSCVPEVHVRGCVRAGRSATKAAVGKIVPSKAVCVDGEQKADDKPGGAKADIKPDKKHRASNTIRIHSRNCWQVTQ